MVSWKQTVAISLYSVKSLVKEGLEDPLAGVSRIFERGGPISLGSLKKGHQILKGGGGSNGLMGGGPVH